MPSDQNMDDLPFGHPMRKALRSLADDIRMFIEISLHDDDFDLEKWLFSISHATPIRCWEIKHCSKTSCPAYKNENVRCWLEAGTMCEGGVKGEFALKYKSCTECNVYQAAVFENPMAEIYEHLITLIHSLKGTQDKLRNLATRDLLTGLYNRNYFNETISREIEYARRNKRLVALIMIDVDNFKQINDTYGHLHGDGILKECAEILTRATRKSDIVCRYGGDEFLIVTSMSGDGDDTAGIVSRIRQYIAGWNAEFGTADYGLSLSIGCATMAEDAHLTDALHEADRLMYEDKRNKA